MANAVKNIVKVEKTVKVDVPEYTLTLSEEEAKVLAVVAARIGGYPNGSRGKMDAIGIALYDAGVRTGPSGTTEGNIRFNDGSFVAW